MNTGLMIEILRCARWQWWLFVTIAIVMLTLLLTAGSLADCLTCNAISNDLLAGLQGGLGNG